MNINDNPLWVEKYRPRTISDTILSEDLKATFSKFVVNKSVPNLILSGSAGVGKTTVAKAMLDELECDYITINGSMNGNIDTLRNEIQSFASSVSFSGGRKYVILDEADYLNASSTQPALRNFMEEFSKNCGFILTCNYLNRIIEPLRSRCSVIEFKINKDDKPKIASQFMKRVVNILDNESVEYEKDAVAALIMKFFPDWRRTLNELQRYSSTGGITSAILTDVSDATFKSLVEMLKAKNFTGLRKWVGESSNGDSTELFRKFYDYASEVMEPNSIPQLVIHLSDYQYKAAFAADPEINIMAFLTEVMVDCSFR